MRSARKAVLGLALGALIAGMLAGCGSDGDDAAAQSATTPAARAESTPVADVAAAAEVTVVAPQEGATVRSDSTEVRGTVMPADATVQVRGEAATVSDGTFEATVKLGPGQNAIDVVASGDGVEPATASVTVMRGKTAKERAADREAERLADERAERRAREEAERKREASMVTVPNLTDERLDVAEDQLASKSLRYTEIGGGTFGVVVPSNWTVCETRPAAGAEVKKGTRVKLIIDRGC
jgi:hypothetical protein